MSWYTLDVCRPLCGASLVQTGSREGSSKGLCLSVGGNLPPLQAQGKKVSASTGPKSLSPLLQISALEVPSAVWKPQLVNSNGQANRQFHACATVSADTVVVFGGLVTATGNGQVAEEILEISPSIFGLNVNVVKRATCNLQGLSAVSFPQQVRDAAFLFGGCTQDKVCSSELMLYLHKDFPDIEGVTSAMTNLTVEGAKPSPRAYHACALTGPENSLLIVHGGQGSDGEMLSDLWMCDLSGVLAVLAEAAAVAESSKVTAAVTDAAEATEAEGSGESKPPLVLPAIQWTCLLDSSMSTVVSPRYQHSGYAYLSIKDDVEPPVPCIRFGVFGGSVSSGKSAGIDIFESTVVGNVASEFVLKESLPVDKSSRVSGAALVTLGSEDVYSGALLLFSGPVGLLKVLNDKSELAVSTRRSVAKNVVAVKQKASEKQQQQQQQQQHQNPQSDLPKKVRYDNGDIYTGHLKRPEGQTDEDPIVPETLVKHGAGFMQYASGETYDGEWFEGVRQGKGTGVLATETYEGAFWADKRHGQGVLKDAATEAVVYQGEFRGGLFHGEGTLIASDEVFQGEFVAHKRHGQGRLVNSDTGYQYEGNWVDDAISGSGSVRDYALCEASAGLQGVYQGPTLDGIPCGPNGICMYQDGSEYCGDWKSGKRNGMGKFVAPNNDVFEGKWVGDQRWKGRWTSAKGNEFYDGFWADNLPHGQGSRLYADATYVDAMWDRGRRISDDKGFLQKTADVAQWGGEK